MRSLNMDPTISSQLDAYTPKYAESQSQLSEVAPVVLEDSECLNSRHENRGSPTDVLDGICPGLGQLGWRSSVLVDRERLY